MNSDSIIPVILCGGSGSRLWPLSRKSYPKQFLNINPENNKSLLQNTQERLFGIKNLKSPILVCNEEHRFIVAEQMRGININPLSIILEPSSKSFLAKKLDTSLKRFFLLSTSTSTRMESRAINSINFIF